MKKLIILTLILTNLNFLKSQNSFFMVKRDSFQGKDYYKYLTKYYSSKSEYLGEHVEIFTPKDSKGDLSLCIKMDRLKEYDSVLNYAFNKYRSWSKIADSLASQPFEKEISTFTTDGCIIDDYGIAIGSDVKVNILFSRKNSYFGEGLINRFIIKSYGTDDKGVRSGIYMVVFEKMKGEPTVDQQFQFYRNMIDADRIKKQYENYNKSLDPFK